MILKIDEILSKIIDKNLLIMDARTRSIDYRFMFV